MNIDDLSTIIPISESASCDECQKENFRGWTNSNSLERKLNKVSKIKPLENKGYEVYSKGDENEFSFEATAALSYYPYNGCSVYQCNTCSGVIFIYLETAGHGARYQARWIPKSVRLEA